MIDAFQLKRASQRPLLNNHVTNNDFGLGGTDLNGRDLAYDGGERATASPATRA